MIDGLGMSSEIALIWVELNLINDKLNIVSGNLRSRYAKLREYYEITTYTNAPITVWK